MCVWLHVCFECGRWFCGKSLYFPLSFAVSVKRFLKTKSVFKKWLSHHRSIFRLLQVQTLMRTAFCSAEQASPSSIFQSTETLSPLKAQGQSQLTAVHQLPGEPHRCMGALRPHFPNSASWKPTLGQICSHWPLALTRSWLSTALAHCWYCPVPFCAFYVLPEDVFRHHEGNLSSESS